MVAFLKALFKRYGSDNIADKAAALSYYTIFSIGPLLFLIFAILGKLIQNTSYKARLVNHLQHLVGPQASPLVNSALNSQSLHSKTGPAFFIGLVGLVLGAIGIFGQLQKSLDDILAVKVGPGAGIKAVIKQKLVSLGLVGAICFMLLVSLVVSALIAATTSHLHGDAATGFLFGLIDFVASLVVSAFLITLLYRTLPEIKLPWKLLFEASLIVSLMFSVGKTVLGFIIGRNHTISAFGAAGSLIALLLWIFYSGQIIFLGAAGISLYTDTHTVKIVPRYPGEKGVLRTRKIEEPLTASLPFEQKIKRKFTRGFKKGWRKTK